MNSTQHATAITFVQTKVGRRAMKPLCILGALLVLLLTGCQPIRPVSAQQPTEKMGQAEEKIQNAMSAAPASIAQDATILDWPAEAGGEFVELRSGSNGWTCL